MSGFKFAIIRFDAITSNWETNYFKLLNYFIKDSICNLEPFH